MGDELFLELPAAVLDGTRAGPETELAIAKSPISFEDQEKLRQLWVRIAEAIQGRKVSFYEVVSILWTAVDILVRVVENFNSLPSETRRQIILAFLGDLFDAYIAPMDIPGVPDFVERTVVDPALRKVLLVIAENAVDALLSWYRQAGGVPSIHAPIQLRPPA